MRRIEVRAKLSLLAKPFFDDTTTLVTNTHTSLSAGTCFTVANCRRSCGVDNVHCVHSNNIVAMLTYHTTGRLLIQAAGGEMNGEDAAMFSELTAVGKKCTEYEPTGLTSTPGPMTVDWACKFLL